jgi:hypothetical protein
MDEENKAENFTAPLGVRSMTNAKMQWPSWMIRRLPSHEPPNVTRNKRVSLVMLLRLVVQTHEQFCFGSKCIPQ